MNSLLEKAFLLQKETDPAWPCWKRVMYYTYQTVLLLAASLTVSLLFLLLAVGSYPTEIFFGYLTSWTTILLNILPPTLLILLAYAVTGRAWAGFLTGGIAAFCLSLGNFFKIQFRDDPLYFEDMFHLREAAQMADGNRYSLFLTGHMVMIAAVLLVGTLLLWLLARGRLRGWRQRLVPAVAAVLVGAALMPAAWSDDLYDAIDNYEFLEQWGDTQNYIAHGFFYPFVHSILDFVQLPPSGYSDAKAEALLSRYENTNIPADKQVNIIAIMREAYADFSRYNIKGLDTSGYELYHQLETESYTGDLVTNIFAGGTIDSERCFLTGSYQIRNFRRNANSYVWYLRQQGYTTEGSHPYYQWFYNRQNVNAYLGMEHYRFIEDGYGTMTDAIYPEDSILLPEIYQDFVRNKSTGKPYFSFSVNVQSHGPYATWDTGNRKLLTGSYSSECQYAITNYLDVIWETDQELSKLMDKLRQDPEPVFLVTFGDHLPWMGDNKIFYEEMGVNLDWSTEEGFYTHFSTRYLIWANDAAKELLGHDVVGEGPAVSPCYLMNLVFRQLGWEGPAYMQAMDELMEVFPVVSLKDRYVVDGVMTETVPAERAALFKEFLYLQYYWSKEFLYS